MKILLDTNAYVALKRDHSEVATLVRRSERVLLSTIVAGELLFGFFHGNRTQQNRWELEAFLANPRVDLLPVTFTTADRFGRIAAALRSQGRPIPLNDIWIAAHAMESGADLVTFDQHFASINGLVVTFLEWPDC